MNNKIAIVGTFFGDEAKGKITHDMSPKYDWVIRTAGANNCGHTIYRNDKKYVHNLIPSFDWREKKTQAFISSNVLVDINHLLKEVETLWAEKPEACSKIVVDPDAFCILPEHIESDKQKNGHLGTTNRGVGPAAVQKMSRSGIKLSSFIKDKDSRISKLKEMGVRFQYNLEFENEFKQSSIIFEGAQGVLIDIDHGTYPFVSCGSSALAGIHAAGFSYLKLDEVYGISKGYTTKVGTGPFPSINDDTLTRKITEIGKEIGATTGRQRSVGYLDLPALQYACTKGGITKLILTKLDVLNNLGDIPICISYEGIKKVFSASQLFDAKPQYIHMKGWKNCSAQCDYQDAMNLHDFICKIQDHVGLKVEYISTGVSEKDFRKWR